MAILMDSLPKIACRLALLANAILLIYFIVFASTKPGSPLGMAVALEVLVFCGLFAYRQWRNRASASRRGEEVLQCLERNSRLFYAISRGLSLSSIVLFGGTCIFLSLDLSALLCAKFGYRDISASIYTQMAPPSFLEIHPALSLELLTGSYIEAQQFANAEPLEMLLLEIRKNVNGEKQESIAAMYANLGDFYRRWNKSDHAEACYKKAIALAQELRLKQGWGSPMTSLGTLLSQQGRFAEAEATFQGALQIRERLFGSNSLKVSETLCEYACLKKRQGKLQEAEAMTARAAGIKACRRPGSLKEEPVASGLSVLSTLLSMLIFWQRERLLALLARLVQLRLHLGRSPGKAWSPGSATVTAAISSVFALLLVSLALIAVTVCFVQAKETKRKARAITAAEVRNSLCCLPSLGQPPDRMVRFHNGQYRSAEIPYADIRALASGWLNGKPAAVCEICWNTGGSGNWEVIALFGRKQAKLVCQGFYCPGSELPDGGTMVGKLAIRDNKIYMFGEAPAEGRKIAKPLVVSPSDFRPCQLKP